MKLRIYKTIAAGLLLAVVSLFIASCGKENVEMRIKMVNGSSEDVHMWVGSGGSPSASNKLKPGESDEYINSFEADTHEDYTYKVNAGQNGTIISTITVSLNHEYPIAVVTFNGVGLVSERAIK